MNTVFQEYENSITHQAELSMNEWAIELSAMSGELMHDPMRVVDSLNDTRNLCTPGFLMRRQIQKCFSGMLEEASRESKEGYVDLFASDNVAWPDALIKSLCSKLTKYAKEEYGQTITTSQWRYWLTDERFPTKRELAVKLSFLLDMDDYTTTKYLLSCGHEPFSVRNPFDCICLFCKQIRPKGDWKKVEAILAEYERGRPKPAIRNNSKKQHVGNIGMTGMISNKIPELANVTAPEYKSEDPRQQYDLIDFLYSIDSELTRREKITRGSYLSGYSLERCRRLRELTRFLAVLYPKYDNAVYAGGDRRVDSRTKRNNAEVLMTKIVYSEEDIKYVRTDDQGYPDLHDLPKAFVYSHDWDFAEASGLGLVEYDKEKGKSKSRTSPKKEYHDNKIPFNREVYRICQSYSEEDRLSRIVLTPDQSEIDISIERKDILLIAFLFISAYSRWGDHNTSTGTSDLYDMLTGMIRESSEDDVFSYEIRCLIGQLDDVVNMWNEYEKIAGYISCVNTFLDLFGYEPFYPPFLLDRFILLALVAEEIGSTALGENCLPENLTGIWLYDGYAYMPEE